jgi:isoleucyl-tRNA synthetase
VDDVKRKMLTLWNCYKFFIDYANLNRPSLRLARASDHDAPLSHALDRWILARLQQLIVLCNEPLDDFDSATVTPVVEEFIDDLSTWYVRQSRRR